MRLSPGQRSALVRVTMGRFGPNTDVYLFVSRLGDASKGGDADILIDVERPVPQIAHFRLVLDFEKRSDCLWMRCLGSRGSIFRSFRR